MQEATGLLPIASLAVIKDSLHPSNLCQPCLFKKESTSIILGGSSNLRNNREQIGERSAETLDLLIDMISYRGPTNILTKIYAKPKSIAGLAFFITLRPVNILRCKYSLSNLGTV
jgi:hypothetical protein